MEREGVYRTKHQNLIMLIVEDQRQSVECDAAGHPTRIAVAWDGRRLYLESPRHHKQTVDQPQTFPASARARPR